MFNQEINDKQSYPSDIFTTEEKTYTSGSGPCRLCQLAGNPPPVTHSHTTAECGSLSGSERKELFTRLRSIYLGEEKKTHRETEGRRLLSHDSAMRPLSVQRAQSRSGTCSSNPRVGPPHPLVFQEQPDVPHG